MKKAFLQLHLAVFLAGFTGILGKLITLNEGLIVWYRLLLTAATMWLLFSVQKKIVRIKKSEIFKIAGVGCIAALHWVTFYGSIKYSNVSIALVCFSSIGFFTAIMEPLIFKTSIKRLELLFGIITIVAISLIFHFDTTYKTGIILGLVSAFLGSLFPIYNRGFLQRINVETMLVWQQTGGFVFLSIALPFYLSWFSSSSILPSWEDVGWLLVLSWFCSVWAFQLSSNALKKLSAFTVNLTYNLEPIYGILLAFAVYGENKMLGFGFYLGFAIIMAVLFIHMVILLWQARKKKPSFY